MDDERSREQCQGKQAFPIDHVNLIRLICFPSSFSISVKWPIRSWTNTLGRDRESKSGETVEGDSIGEAANQLDLRRMVEKFMKAHFSDTRYIRVEYTTPMFRFAVKYSDRHLNH